MGKKLIIKGANFVANAITDVDYSAVNVILALTYTNLESTNYGKIVSNTNFTSCKIPVLVQAGKTVDFFLVDNGNVQKTIQNGYILSTSNITVAVNNTIPTNSILKGSAAFDSNNGHFTVVNDTSYDAYLYLTFTIGTTANGKIVYYAIVD